MIAQARDRQREAEDEDEGDMDDDALRERDMRRDQEDEQDERQAHLLHGAGAPPEPAGAGGTGTAFVAVRQSTGADINNACRVICLRSSADSPVSDFEQGEVTVPAHTHAHTEVTPPARVCFMSQIASVDGIFDRLPP